MSAREGVPRLTFGAIDRETLMQIGRSSQQSSARNTPRGERAAAQAAQAAMSSARGYSARNSPRPASAAASPRKSHAAAASSRQSSRPASPGRPATARSAAFSRAGSGETSSLDAAGTYDQASSKVMKQLYEEREEKRRLLHLMRTATGPPDSRGAPEPWNRAAAAERGEAGPAAPHAALSERGRGLEATSNGYRPRAVFSPDARVARPATDRPQARPNMAQTPEDTRSKGFGFMLPFDVALPSFASVFAGKSEEEAASAAAEAARGRAERPAVEPEGLGV